MKNIILAGFLLGVVSAPSHAADWMHILDSDTDKYYIDLDSIKTVNSYNKDLIQAWYKMEVYNDIVKDGMGVGDKALVLYNIDCRKETMAILQAIKYKGGNPLDGRLDVKVPNMRAVIPDSIGAEMLDRACAIYKIQEE